MKYKKVRANQRLREIITEKGVIPYRMAMEIGMQAVGIYSLISGRASGIKYGQAIADYLNVDFDDVFETIETEQQLYRAKEELKTMITDRQIVQCQMAATIGISEETLSKVVRRLSGSQYTSRKICKFLDVEFDEIFERVAK